jgi:hypothetical protein
MYTVLQYMHMHTSMVHVHAHGHLSQLSCGYTRTYTHGMSMTHELHRMSTSPPPAQGPALGGGHVHNMSASQITAGVLQ